MRARGRSASTPREQQSKNRRVAGNSGWQLVVFAARAVSGLGAVVLIARGGGPQALGVFQFAMTLTAMVPYFYGLPSLLAREVARRPEDGRRWVETGTLITLLFGVGFTVLFAVGVRVVGASPVTAAAVPLASLGMAFDAVARVQFAAFWGWERMDLEAKVTVVQEVAFVVAVAAVVQAGGSAQAAILAFTLTRALGALLSWAVVSRHLGGLVVPRATRRWMRSTLATCTPFAVNDTLTLTYMRADSVLLGVFKGPTAVGLYQAGTNLVLYLNVLARSINYALYPRMSRSWPHDLRRFRRLRDGSFRALGLISVPIAVGCLLLAGQIFSLLYGPKFDRAVVTYQLLVLVIPIRMLGNTLSLSLSAIDLQTRRTIAVTVAAGLNLALNLYFIPRWSYVGAAVTTVICETSLLLIYAAFLRRAAGRSDIVRALSLPATAAIPMIVTILLTRNGNLFLSGALGLAAYGLALLAIAMVRSPREQWSRPVDLVTGLLRSRSEAL